MKKKERLVDFENFAHAIEADQGSDVVINTINGIMVVCIFIAVFFIWSNI